MSDYVVFQFSTKVKNACVLGEIKGFDDLYDLMSGVSFANSFPTDVEFEMSPDFPDNIVLTDNLDNPDNIIVGSARLKSFLESQGIHHMEYLPVSIRNHKGKIASKDYFIINPTHPVNCLDEAASEPKANLILPGEIRKVNRLVLDQQKIDPSRDIFRIARFPMVTLVHRRLAESIDKERFTGVRWLDISKYPEI